jgi:hypothetical protein
MIVGMNSMKNRGTPICGSVAGWERIRRKVTTKYISDMSPMPQTMERLRR